MSLSLLRRLKGRLAPVAVAIAIGSVATPPALAGAG
jgi:hypothetical protein